MDFGRHDVLSFDCYGTLIDWEGGLISGIRPILENHGVDVADEEILALQARTESGLQATSKPGAADTVRGPRPRLAASARPPRR